MDFYQASLKKFLHDGTANHGGEFLGSSKSGQIASTLPDIERRDLPASPSVCREAGEEIVSEEYGRQIRPCWLVVQAQGHQRHGLDDSKAILEAPTKKV
jgi:hypothetical protein